MSDQQMDTVLAENRKFPPPPEFTSKAHIKSMEEYQALHKRSIEDPDGFWSEVASELHWFKKWDTVLNDSDKPFFKWFEGGKTNICYNCLDRHLDGPNRDKPAIVWEGEPGDSATLTYAELHSLVCRFANVLKSLGVGKGDRVAIYLPMVVELPAAVLACARIGAVHNVIFAGFSSESIKDRVLDSEAKLVITADAGWRRGKILALKEIVDAGVDECDCVENVLVVKRGIEEEFAFSMKEGRDHWYHELAEGQSDDCPAEELDAEDMLFLLYTSGTTGKPKGIMHTQAGYMVYTYLTAKYVFDLKPEDVYWCTADVGWITGHSYLIYGPMQNAATCVVYEGAPNWPDNGRFWEIVEKYRVSIFYTAPTAIRAFMKWGDEWPQKRDLSSLRLLGTVGESINPEAWMWYHELIGGKRCPIVDTYWQTETGGIILSPLPGVTPTKPGSATLPFFGIDPAVLADDGEEVRAGILSVRQPWPGMTRGIWGDQQRYKDTYWCKWGGEYYFPGDGARKDEDGYIWILGRVDDVVNVSGHRIGTAELESIYVEHPSVAESAVIGVAHEIKGQGLVSFVTVRQGFEADEALAKALNGLVAQKIGKFAMPERIVFSPDLPKTRSGKIMRRLLRDIAEGRELGNVTTLADPSIVESLQDEFNKGA
jgi:acetyl-CoA synthetase